MAQQQGNTDYVGAVLDRLDQLRDEYMSRARQIAKDEHGILDEQVTHARKRLRGSGFVVSNDNEDMTMPVPSRQPLGEKSINEDTSNPLLTTARAQTAEYKYSELQAELKKRQINAKGKKEILKERLDQAIAAELAKAAQPVVDMDTSEDVEIAATSEDGKTIRKTSDETSITVNDPVVSSESGATTVAVPRQPGYLATLIGIFDQKGKQKNADEATHPQAKSPTKKIIAPLSPKTFGQKQPPPPLPPPAVETAKPPTATATSDHIVAPQVVQSIAPPTAVRHQKVPETTPMDEDAKCEKENTSKESGRNLITTTKSETLYTKPEPTTTKAAWQQSSGKAHVSVQPSRPVTTTSTSRLEGVRARQERERLRAQAEHAAREKERQEKAAAARREQEELAAKRAEERKKLQDAANLRRQQQDDSRLKQKVNKPPVPAVNHNHQQAPGLVPPTLNKGTIPPRPPQHPPPNYHAPSPPIQHASQKQLHPYSETSKVLLDGAALPVTEKQHATAPDKAAPQPPIAAQPVPTKAEQAKVPQQSPHTHGPGKYFPPRLTPMGNDDGFPQDVQKSAAPRIGAGVPRYHNASGNTKRIPPRLSPPETYDMTDHEGSTDCESDDESGGPEKHVPTWAQNPQLREALHRQEAVDPLHYFSFKATSCDLNDVFNTQRPFKRRTSSQNWSQDDSTHSERQKYRIEMGFTPPK